MVYYSIISIVFMHMEVSVNIVMLIVRYGVNPILELKLVVTSNSGIDYLKKWN